MLSICNPIFKHALLDKCIPPRLLMNVKLTICKVYFNVLLYRICIMFDDKLMIFILILFYRNFIEKQVKWWEMDKIFKETKCINLNQLEQIEDSYQMKASNEAF